MKLEDRGRSVSRLASTRSHGSACVVIEPLETCSTQRPSTAPPRGRNTESTRTCSTRRPRACLFATRDVLQATNPARGDPPPVPLSSGCSSLHIQDTACSFSWIVLSRHPIRGCQIDCWTGAGKGEFHRSYGKGPMVNRIPPPTATCPKARSTTVVLVWTRVVASCARHRRIRFPFCPDPIVYAFVEPPLDASPIPSAIAVVHMSRNAVVSRKKLRFNVIARAILAGVRRYGPR
jgi:hypothetical protein